MERPGDLQAHDVIYSACDGCPGEYHRGWLVRRNERFNDGWVLEPAPGHVRRDTNFIVADRSVPDGYVWKPVDEARDDEQDRLENAIVNNEAGLRAAMIKRWHPERIVKVPG